MLISAFTNTLSTVLMWIQCTENDGMTSCMLNRIKADIWQRW